MKQKILIFFSTLLLCLLLPLPASANSAGNPYLTVLVEHPPAGLTLTLTVGEGESQKSHTVVGERMLWEGYYRFYNHFWSPWVPEGTPVPNAVLQVDTGKERFSLPVDPQSFTYDGNLVTLDLQNQRLLYGQPWWRTPLLIALRLGLTLALEGGIFWLFGYRTLRSWLVFLGVNLVTQGAVNAALHLLIPTGTQYFLVLGLFFYTPMEMGVLLVEMLVLSLLVKEYQRRRAVGYAACANLCSWVLGGALLAVLPL